MYRNRKTFLTFLLFAALLMITAICSIMFGSVNIPLSQIISAFSTDDRFALVVLLSFRLPRLLAASLAGAGLSTAGMLLQTVTDNDLCAPNIIGVNSGAGLFVLITLCLFPSWWRMLPVAAFIGAILTTFSVLIIARFNGAHGQKTTLVLAGVALSSLMNAGISFLSLKYPDVLSSYTSFSVGGFSGIRMEQLAFPAVIIGIAFLCALFAAPKIYLLCLGDESAASLGVNVKMIRNVTIIIASALCAAVVSFAGLLGFAGLIVPHVVRRISSGSLREQLCLSLLCGAFIVSLSDFIGRTVFSPWEVPAGIIMAFIGAPFFIYLIVRRRKLNDRV